MRDRKYIEFLKDVVLHREKMKYIKNVKYRVVDETNDSYIVSKKKNISFSKMKEGELFSTGLY